MSPYFRSTCEVCDNRPDSTFLLELPVKCPECGHGDLAFSYDSHYINREDTLHIWRTLSGAGIAISVPGAVYMWLWNSEENCAGWLIANDYTQEMLLRVHGKWVKAGKPEKPEED
jgi:hypothetical protein